MVLAVPPNEVAKGIRLVFNTAGSHSFEVESPANPKISHDPYHQAGARFWEAMKQMGSGTVLEIGSRNRSGVVRRSSVPSGMEYVGFDIVAGENVDVVGDAHFLTKYFSQGSFDVVLAFSVFEHLLMPWKVVIEMNRVMKLGGVSLITTHQTWPLHEEPWDFWRYSSHAWQALFNPSTGFEIIETAMGEPASVVPHLLHPVVISLDTQPCYLGSLVALRKVGDTRLTWEVDPKNILKNVYPA